MKEKHTLDELFKEKLAEHSSPVPDHLWKGVMSKRGARGAVGGYDSGLLWLAIAGILLVGSGGYLSTQYASAEQDDFYSGRIVSAAYNPLEDLNGAAAGEEQYTSDNEDKFGMSAKDVPSNPEIGPHDNGVVPVKRKMDIDSTALSSKAEKPTVDDGPIAPTKYGATDEVRKTKGDRSSNVRVVKSNDDKASSSHVATSTKGLQNTSPKPINGSYDVAAPSSATIRQDGLEQNYPTDPASSDLNAFTTSLATSLPSIRPTDLHSDLLTDPDLSMKTPPTAHGPRKQLWYVDVTGGYYNLDPKWVAGDAESGRDLRIDSETFDNAFDIGARAGYQMKSGLGFNIGLMFSGISSTVSATNIISDSIITTTLDSVGWVFDSTQNVILTVYDTITMLSIEETSKQVTRKNKYSVLQIPISVGYAIQKGRFEVGVRAGVSLDLLISSDVMYPIRTSSSPNLGQPDSDLAELESGSSSIRTGLSFFANVSAAYLLTEQLHLLVEPTFRTGSLPFESGGSAHVKLNYLGLRGGLRYLF